MEIGSEEYNRKIAEVAAELCEENMPNSDGTCKEPGCRGRMVKDVLGMFRGTITYTYPRCEKCKRVYLYAEHATPVGHEEFLESLTKPMTI